MSSSAANAAPRTFMRFPARMVRRYWRAFRSMKRIESPSRRSARLSFCDVCASFGSVCSSSGCNVGSGMRHRLRAPAPDFGDEATIAADLARRGHPAPLALAQIDDVGGVGEQRESATQVVRDE